MVVAGLSRHEGIPTQQSAAASPNHKETKRNQEKMIDTEVTPYSLPRISNRH